MSLKAFFNKKSSRFLAKVIQQAVQSFVFSVIGGGGAFFDIRHYFGVEGDSDRDTEGKAIAGIGVYFMQVGKAGEAGAARD